MDHWGRNDVVVRVAVAIRSLQTQRPTLAQLAQEMGTSERTARRYVDALMVAQFPIRRYGPHYRIEEA